MHVCAIIILMQCCCKKSTHNTNATILLLYLGMKSLKIINLDKLGITASTVCAIHCAALPFLLTLLPLWGLDFLANPMLEISMILISLVLGIWSLGKSFKKVHQNIGPLFLLATGFAIILVGHFSGGEFLEPVLIPIGGLTIASAHLINLRLFKRCKHHH